MARLFTMIAFLAILVMLMQKARDPGMWEWAAPRQDGEVIETVGMLKNKVDNGRPQAPLRARPVTELFGPSNLYAQSPERPSEAKLVPVPTLPVAVPDQETPATEASNKPDETPKNSPIASPGDALNAQPQPTEPTVPDKAAPPLPDVTVPIDQDPTEMAEFDYNKSAISDGFIGIKREEMHAYRQLVRWVKEQPVEVLKRRAKPNPLYSRFMSSPDEQRGRIFSLNVHVRQSDMAEIEGVDGDATPLTLVEATAFTPQSKYFPYKLMLVDADDDFPIKNSINEDGVFYGYFFKQLGYETQLTKPGNALKLPILVGRLVWHKRTPVDKAESFWLWAVFGGVILTVFVMIRIGLSMSGKTKSTFVTAGRPIRSKAPEADVESWLDETLSPNSDSGENSNQESDEFGNNPGSRHDSDRGPA